MKSHYLFFILIIIFAALHKHGSDLIVIISPALGLYLLDEVIRANNLVRYNAHVVNLSKIGESYLAIELKLIGGRKGEGRWGGRMGWMGRRWRKMKYHSYQWSNLFIPSIAFFQLHPFSFASSPLVDQNRLLFIVKRESQWTKKFFEKVKKYQKEHPDKDKCDQNRMIRSIVPFVQLDGPYGSITNGKPIRYGVQMMISGGVGVTPNISLFKSLVYENSKKKVNEKMKIVFVWTGRGANLFRFTQSLFLPSLLSSLHRSTSSSSSPSSSPSSSLSSSSSSSLSSSSSSSSPLSSSLPSFDVLKQNFIKAMTGMTNRNGREEEEELDGLISMSNNNEEDEEEEEDDRIRADNYSLLFDEMTSYCEFYDIRLFQSAIDSTEIVPDIDNNLDNNNNNNNNEDDQKMGEMMKEMSAISQKTHEIDQFIQLGRPDLNLIFDDVKSYAKLNHKRKVSVFACGPAPLVRKSIRLSSIHSSPFLRFDVHHERFDI